MCEPISLTTGILLAAGVGTSAAGAIINYKSQKQQAQIQQEQNNEMKAANDAAAKLATHQTLGDLTNAELEQVFSGAEQTEATKMAGNKSVATATVAAGEAGVMGHSVEATLNDIKGQEARRINNTQTQLDWSLQQLQRQKEGAIVQGENEINAFQPVQVQQPSPLSPILQIAGSGLSLIDYMQKRKTALGTTNTSAPTGETGED